MWVQILSELKWLSNASHFIRTIFFGAVMISLISWLASILHNHQANHSPIHTSLHYQFIIQLLLLSSIPCSCWFISPVFVLNQPLKPVRCVDFIRAKSRALVLLGGLLVVELCNEALAACLRLSARHHAYKLSACTGFAESKGIICFKLYLRISSRVTELNRAVKKINIVSISWRMSHWFKSRKWNEWFNFRFLRGNKFKKKLYNKKKTH